MKLLKWLYNEAILAPLNYIKNLINTKGVLYTIYFLVIGLALSILIKLWKDVKELGWFLGVLVILITLAIFYSPAIAFTILYFHYGDPTYIASATSWIMLWIVVPGTPAIPVISALALFILEIVKYIKRASIKKVIKNIELDNPKSYAAKIAKEHGIVDLDGISEEYNAERKRP